MPNPSEQSQRKCIAMCSGKGKAHRIGISVEVYSLYYKQVYVCVIFDRHMD